MEANILKIIGIIEKFGGGGKCYTRNFTISSFEELKSEYGVLLKIFFSNNGEVNSFKDFVKIVKTHCSLPRFMYNIDNSKSGQCSLAIDKLPLEDWTEFGYLYITEGEKLLNEDLCEKI